MKSFSLPIQMRWSDLDPNFHLRHSVYYDWGALCRIEFLNKFGLTADEMARLHFGPILFREECVFRKEIRMGDTILIDLKIVKARKDFSRWSIQHHITKGDNVLSAVLSVDGAWINMSERKLATPPEAVHNVFNLMPKAENFEWV